MDQLLKQTPLTDFCGIGKRIEKRLNKIGVTNVKELQQAHPEILYEEFGNKATQFLKSLSLGEGSLNVAHVDTKSTPKSIGHQHTLSKNTSDHVVLKRNMQRLSNMVGKRLRGKKMVGKSVGLYLRDKDFKGHFERKTLNIHTDSSQKIYKVAQDLFDSLDWNKQTRLVGISIWSLVPKNQTSLPLFAKDTKTQKLDSAIDTINDRFGSFTITPANTVLADKTKEKSVVSCATKSDQKPALS